MKNCNIIVAGDFHGRFSEVNKFLCAHQKIDIILQCGDFGYWPRLNGSKSVNNMGKIETFSMNKLKAQKTKIFWCDGNHEDFQELLKLGENPEILPNVFYMNRGSILELPDKRKVLFIGGAFSIDRSWRILGESWFTEETISQRDIEELPDENIDIIISHTCPTEFKVVDYHDMYGHDPSRDALSYVLKKYKPKLWYFGHMHLFKQGKYNDCKWTCLSGIGLSGRWWIPLDE